jgi:hypothetical protein
MKKINEVILGDMTRPAVYPNPHTIVRYVIVEFYCIISQNYIV